MFESYALYLPFLFAYLLYAAFAVLRRDEGGRRERADLTVAALGLAFYGVKLWRMPPAGADLGVFHGAAVAVAAGRNPYDDVMVLNPPPGLALLRIFGLFGFPTLLVLWTAFNAVGTLALVPLATRAVGSLPRGVVAVLAVALLLSIPVHFATSLGQLSVATALAGTAALVLAERGRPLSAGLVLALAVLKPQNAVPLLASLSRGRAWIAWPAFAVMVAVLTPFGGPASELPTRLRQMKENIVRLSRPGMPNDFTGTGPHAHTILGMERLLWCAGVRDAVAARVAGAVLAGAAGLSLAAAIALGRIGTRAGSALGAVYLLLFLYHRTHDAMILAVPLVYVAIELRARREGRGALVGAFTAMLLVLFIHPRVLESVADRLPGIGAPLFLPLPTTLLVLAGGLIAADATRVARARDALRPAAQ